MSEDSTWALLIALIVNISVFGGVFYASRYASQEETQTTPTFETRLIEVKGEPYIILIGTGLNKGEILGIACDESKREQ